MKTEIRLGSVIKDGVGGPEAGAIGLIYAFLLCEFEQDVYNHIGINQIGKDLDEVIIKRPGNNIYINIRYPFYENFASKTPFEKNQIRLDITHLALTRIAEYDKKISIDKLDKIRKKIIDNNFSFDIPFKSCVNNFDKIFSAQILVNPESNKFNYYVLILENGIQKCKKLIYSGETETFYFNYFFKNAKWENINELIITGEKKQVQISVSINCDVKFLNLTTYSKPPLFEMFKVDISQKEKDEASANWRNSLPTITQNVLNNSLKRHRN